jgi:hypothetical protein
VYYLQDFTAQRTMHEVVLPSQLAYGMEWTLDDGTECSITNTEAAVTVPYGSFAAIEVTKVLPDSTVKEYYAAGFGLIKRVFIPGGDTSAEIVSALSVYEEGNPTSQSVRQRGDRLHRPDILVLHGRSVNPEA